MVVVRREVGRDSLVIECLFDSAGERVVRLHESVALSAVLCFTCPTWRHCHVKLMESLTGAWPLAVTATQIAAGCRPGSQLQRRLWLAHVSICLGVQACAPVTA